jgi:predicted RNase H-like nuclease
MPRAGPSSVSRSSVDAVRCCRIRINQRHAEAKAAGAASLERNILQATSPSRFAVPARGPAYAKIMLKQQARARRWFVLDIPFWI